jgi:hypothetical protein
MKITKQELRELIKEEVARVHMEESNYFSSKSKKKERNKIKKNIEDKIKKGLESGKYDKKRAKEIRDAFRAWDTYSQKHQKYDGIESATVKAKKLSLKKALQDLMK